jgi:2-keto-4-pentenoate hydratase
MNVDEVIESLLEHARQGVYYPEKWRGRLTQADAYRVQLGILARLVAGGEVQAGWKIGLTARAMQIQQGVHEPVFGFLLASGARPSGAVFDWAALVRPGFENELCLTVGTTLRGPGVTLAQARAAISAAAPALEIVERRGDFAADLNLALADNAQQKAFVTGTPTSPLPPELDLGTATVDVFVNDARVEHATGAAVMGDAAAALAWLANKLGEFGRPLAAGMRVMSGSFTRQYALNPGDRVESRFAPFGPVRASFR